MIEIYENDELVIGGGDWELAPFRFSKILRIGGGTSPSWRDIVVSGTGAVTLTNSLADGLNYVKLKGECALNPTVTGYTNLGWLRSTGQQYIDTGIAGAGAGAVGTLSIEVVFRYPQYVDELSLYGNWTSGSNNGYWASIKSNNGINVSNFSLFNPFASYGTINTPNVWHTLRTEADGKVYLDGVLLTTLTVENTGRIENICLFNRSLTNPYDTAGERNLDIKRFTARVGTGVIHNFIAKKRNSDNVLGMYDTITGTFFTNVGSGTFTAGAEETTPDAPSDIICNNGVIKGAQYNSDVFTVSGSPVITSGGIASGFSSSNYATIPNTLIDDNNFILELVFTTNNNFYSNQYQTIWSVGASDSDCVRLTTSNSSLALTSAGSHFSTGVFGKTLAKNTTYKFKMTINSGTIELHLDNLTDSTDIWTDVTINITTAINNTYGLIVGKKGYGDAFPYTDGSIYLNTVKISRNGTQVVSGAKGVEVVGNQEIVGSRSASNKNLLNMIGAEIAEGCYIDGTDGHLVRYTGLNTCLRYTPVEPSTTYTFSGEGLGSSDVNFRICEYGTDKSFISRSTETGIINSYTFTTGANTYYIRFHYSNSSNINKMQLETGSIATAYEPYFDGGTATAEMLLKVGDYQDVQSVLDGEVTRNVGIKVLDGTENWVARSGSSTHYVYFDYSGINANTETELYCTHFGITTRNTPEENKMCVRLNRNGFMFCNDLLCADNNTWKAFLTNQYNAGTPVIVVYPLATATTETVAGQTLTTTAGNNIIEITQSSIDNLGLEVSYKKAT